MCACVRGCVRGGGWGNLWAVSKVQTSVRAPRLPGFILLRSFSDTLLVVSVLDIVYETFVAASAFLKGLISIFAVIVTAVQ